MDPDLFQDTGFSQFMGYSKVLRFSDIFVCSEGREGCLSMDQIIAKTWANEINSRRKCRDVYFSRDGTR